MFRCGRQAAQRECGNQLGSAGPRECHFCPWGPQKTPFPHPLQGLQAHSPPTGDLIFLLHHTFLYFLLGKLHLVRVCTNTRRVFIPRIDRFIVVIIIKSNNNNTKIYSCSSGLIGTHLTCPNLAVHGDLDIISIPLQSMTVLGSLTLELYFAVGRFPRATTPLNPIRSVVNPSLVCGGVCLGSSSCSDWTAI